VLLLSLDLQIGPGRNPLPAHLGGALHGFVEGGVKNHAPHLLPVLRPNGPNEAAHFMILPPPLGVQLGEVIRFAVVLYGTVTEAWPVLLRALLDQQSSGLNGRNIRIVQAWCANPGGEAFPLLEQGQLLEYPDELPVTRSFQAMVAEAPEGEEARSFHRLAFRSPLLLASRKAQRDRERMSAGLPWPSLGAVLDSIAGRMRAMESELADALGLPSDWIAPDSARGIAPLTPAASPAQQIEWDYTSTPRTNPDESPATRRSLPIQGIVGDLIYPATGIEFEQQLLYWGQWLGVGQKTTMGCGSYSLISQ
jgi:hypothetical protein